MNIFELATLSQLIPLLSEIAKGNARHVSERVKETLQDRGLIDHRDQMTDAGRAALANNS